MLTITDYNQQKRSSQSFINSDGIEEEKPCLSLRRRRKSVVTFDYKSPLVAFRITC